MEAIMVALIVILCIVAFITADVLIRVILQRLAEAKLRKERQAALETGLRLDFADEAKTLKRVEVTNSKAKILAVDDEEVVLSSFRKILVLAGYSIDTVETGQEALMLVQHHDYDFVFTDLKMPEMDGVEVVKGVKHLRPDIDVIVITGYATIETAVETMKYGAMDYVQKPFTEDELVDFVNKTYIRRQDRLERQIKPKIHLVTPTSGESPDKHTFNVPAGIFIAPEHTWVSIQLNGMARVGLDDFAQKIIGEIDDVKLPKIDQVVKKGEPLFTIKHLSNSIQFFAPISGKVTAINTELISDIDAIKYKPYAEGWICNIEPERLTEELPSLKIGADALAWYQQEVDTYIDLVKKISDPDAFWTTISKMFFQPKTESGKE